jgi:hypothetical protein
MNKVSQSVKELVILTSTSVSFWNDKMISSATNPVLERVAAQMCGASSMMKPSTYPEVCPLEHHKQVLVEYPKSFCLR